MTPTTYPADRTALLIVDPYNDFMSEGGKLYEATRETADAVGFYDNMRKLIPAIRAARIQVIIVPHHRRREGDYAGWKHMNPTHGPGRRSGSVEDGGGTRTPHRLRGGLRHHREPGHRGRWLGPPDHELVMSK